MRVIPKKRCSLRKWVETNRLLAVKGVIMRGTKRTRTQREKEESGKRINFAVKYE